MKCFYLGDLVLFRQQLPVSNPVCQWHLEGAPGRFPYPTWEEPVTGACPGLGEGHRAPAWQSP